MHRYRKALQESSDAPLEDESTKQWVHTPVPFSRSHRVPNRNTTASLTTPETVPYATQSSVSAPIRSFQSLSGAPIQNYSSISQSDYALFPRSANEKAPVLKPIEVLPVETRDSQFDKYYSDILRAQSSPQVPGAESGTRPVYLPARYSSTLPYSGLDGKPLTRPKAQYSNDIPSDIQIGRSVRFAEGERRSRPDLTPYEHRTGPKSSTPFELADSSNFGAQSDEEEADHSSHIGEDDDDVEAAAGLMALGAVDDPPGSKTSLTDPAQRNADTVSIKTGSSGTTLDSAQRLYQVGDEGLTKTELAAEAREHQVLDDQYRISTSSPTAHVRPIEEILRPKHPRPSSPVRPPSSYDEKEVYYPPNISSNSQFWRHETTQGYLGNMVVQSASNNQLSPKIASQVRKARSRNLLSNFAGYASKINPLRLFGVHERKSDSMGRRAEEALYNANIVFRARKSVQSVAVVADFVLEFKKGYHDRTAAINVSSFRDNKLFRNAAFSPLYMGFRIIYILDDDNLAKETVEKYFTQTPGDNTWSKFQAWIARKHQAKGALGKISRWFPRHSQQKRRLDFAFGIEHCDRFATSRQDGSLLQVLDVVDAARRSGVYERSHFNTVAQTPRHAVYFCDDELSGQQTVIIVHSRPSHYLDLDLYPRDWGDRETWAELLNKIENPIPENSLRKLLFGLLRDIMTHIMNETLETWSAKMVELQTQFMELEMIVYSQPASDDLSDDLWRISKYLLEAQQMMGQHSGTMDWLQKVINTYAIAFEARDSDPDAEMYWKAAVKESWLQDQINEMNEIAQSVDSNLKEPIDKMLDLVNTVILNPQSTMSVTGSLYTRRKYTRGDHPMLLLGLCILDMYKSISIRDARLSLELNASLWRLSWITFIFLPLTFLVGFFGMNVDMFAHEPSLKWYFIAAVPFMIFVFIAWMIFKRSASRKYGAHAYESTSKPGHNNLHRTLRKEKMY